MRQFLEIKNKYPGMLLLFRMGDFYETFNEDAKITSKVLGIVLTKRANGAAAKVPLAGFPYHALDNYLHKLVMAGHKVAICEQVEDAKQSKGIVKREVVEVITPGTITSEQALDQKANQFLASLITSKNRSGYAIYDQSTGEFYVGECASEKISEALRKFSPREILLGESVVYSTAVWYKELNPFISKIEDWFFNFDQGYNILIKHFNTNSLKGFGCEDFTLAIAAAGAIFQHIKENLNGSLKHVTTIKPVQEQDIMGLDGFTVRNLEIFKSLATQGTHGTLLSVLDQTLTAGGGRLLKSWLNRPLIEIKRLNLRLQIVSDLLKHKQILEELRTEFKECIDLERILGKVSNGKANPRDIVNMLNSLKRIPFIKKIFEKDLSKSLNALNNRFPDLTDLTSFLDKTLDPQAPLQIKKGAVINSGIDAELDELRTLSSGGKEWIVNLQLTERERTSIPSLKIGYNRVFGYYLEITRTHRHKVPDDYILKQTLINTERFITPELKEYEEKILSADGKIEIIESRIFNDVCLEILNYSADLQKTAQLLSRIDLLCTFSVLALENNYCRPKLVSDHILKIKDGRHPVVEKLLGATERFIGNDLIMDTKINQIHLVTGPNMAGKSTYLRQVGLIVLMAQIGSFVPARSAAIGIVDKLFTRVGASDNLAGGESTFLVEMNEAANILNNASDKSLILLDEIGRGTATYDGLALAWSISEYLHNQPEISARTIFATHYHELTDLENTLERLENHHIAVKEFGDKIVFLRKIMQGPGDKSYGIHVAKMAGLPDKVVQRATEILNHHLQSQKAEDSLSPPEMNQVSIFEKQESDFKKDLAQVEVDKITPLEAIMKLDQLKKKHGI